MKELTDKELKEKLRQLVGILAELTQYQLKASVTMNARNEHSTLTIVITDSNGAPLRIKGEVTHLP